MGTLKEKLITYLDQNVEPKLISYEPAGDGFSVHMRDKAQKTTEQIAQDIIDIFWDME